MAEKGGVLDLPFGGQSQASSQKPLFAGVGGSKGVAGKIVKSIQTIKTKKRFAFHRPGASRAYEKQGHPGPGKSGEGAGLPRYGDVG